MRSFFGSIACLVLLWAAYLISPYWGLYDLAKAVADRDVESVRQRIVVPELRRSLARQIAAASARNSGPKQEQNVLGSSLASSALDQALEPYVTAEAMVSLLGGGGTQPGLPQLRLDLPALNSGALLGMREAGQLWLATSWRGFTGFLFRVPITSHSDEAGSVRLEFRIRDYRWKLTGLDLSHAALAQLRKEMVRRTETAS